MPRILIVEDNPKYREGADRYFSRQSGLETAYAIDYDAAMPLLPGDPRQDGVISDVFFPRKTGSGDITLGREAIERMRSTDPEERARKKFEMIKETVLKDAGKYAAIDDELKGYLMNFVDSYSDKEKIMQNPVILSIKQVGETLKSPEAAALILKNTMRIYKEREHRVPRKDYFGALEKAIQESEANQPLGILIGERADELGIPFILATSTYHHDILTQPVQNYAGTKGWRLIDCGPGNEDNKATPEFWEKAYKWLSSD